MKQEDEAVLPGGFEDAKVGLSALNELNCLHFLVVADCTVARVDQQERVEAQYLTILYYVEVERIVIEDAHICVNISETEGLTICIVLFLDAKGSLLQDLLWLHNFLVKQGVPRCQLRFQHGCIVAKISRLLTIIHQKVDLSCCVVVLQVKDLWFL